MVAAGVGGERPQELGQPEVEHLHEVPLGQHHVGALDVAMDDAVGVGLVERVGDLHADLERLGHRQRSACHPVGEQLALDVLHRNEQVGAVLDQVVGDGDVGRAQHRRGARLANQPRPRLAVLGIGGGEELERHLTPEPGVLGQEHLAHAARAEAFNHAVVQELRPRDRDRGGHPLILVPGRAPYRPS